MEFKDNSEIFGVSSPYFHLYIGEEKSFSVYCLSEFKIKKENYCSKMIRGKKCNTKEKLFDEFAAAFQFPDYFGENWDAFNECINDLDWISAKGYFIFISCFDLFLKSYEQDLKIFVEVMEAAGKSWTNAENENANWEKLSTPFHIILHAEKEKEVEVRTRLLKMQCNFSILQIF